MAVLAKAGYQRVETPLKIASVQFDLAAAFVGTAHNPDLIVVFDTAFEPDDQIQRKVEGIGRALDVMGSRRPLTVVLAGPRPRASILDALSRVSRVLPVGTAIDTDPDAVAPDSLVSVATYHSRLSDVCLRFTNTKTHDVVTHL
jgi:hypothetical protein